MKLPHLLAGIALALSTVIAARADQWHDPTFIETYPQPEASAVPPTSDYAVLVPKGRVRVTVDRCGAVTIADDTGTIYSRPRQCEDHQ